MGGMNSIVNVFDLNAYGKENNNLMQQMAATVKQNDSFDNIVKNNQTNNSTK